MRRPFFITAGILALLLFAVPRPSRADEFKLKDGSVIIGTVVGYQGNAFKVKTSYGYALVEKDKIVSIKIANAPEPAEQKKAKKESMKTGKTPAAKPAKTAHGEEPAITEKKSALPPTGLARKASELNTTASASRLSVKSSANDKSRVEVRPESTVAPNSSPLAQTTAVAAGAPSAPPEPQPIREKISGNTYINDTYSFEMYKPPDWQIMDGARSVLPGAVAAMGTDDQSTYLVIGQEAGGKSAADDMATTEKRLGDILADFRPLDDEHLTISGEKVIAHRFRGNIDEHDWSGFMVFVPRGEKLYTIFGMTRADNDLVQIQENVIRRTIASFQFLPQ
jgi:hypothetical protein